MEKNISRFVAVVSLSFIFILAGCSSTYFNVMEKLGHPKRELLVTRVEAARDSQTDAKEQFKSALDKFQSVVAFKGGSLEAQYRTLEAEYRRSQSEADKVSARIESVKEVAEALFEEWSKEIKSYSNSRLREQSKHDLDETRTRYKPLITQMERARAKMTPVLAAFHDQVLFLKHNLNARAISSLKGELGTIESDVARLIKEMEQSIAEANQFVGGMARGD